MLSLLLPSYQVSFTGTSVLNILQFGSIGLRFPIRTVTVYSDRDYETLLCVFDSK